MTSKKEPMPKHIPAWRRLGLKLKIAKEDPDDSIVIKGSSSNGKRRKGMAESDFALEYTHTDRPAKKSKKAVVNSPSTTVTPPGLAPLLAEVVLSRKHKSVAFTPDTKVEDGESAKQLFQTWQADWAAQDPTFNMSTASSALQVITPKPAVVSNSSPKAIIASASMQNEKKADKPKKSKEKKVKAQLPQSLHPHEPPAGQPALKYLTTYHTSYTTWKFSKPHQNYLIRHLFSPTHIPLSYDTALLHYLRGLKGTSARSRIRQQALAIRSEDTEWLASTPTVSEEMENETHEQCAERRRRDYEAAVTRLKEKLRAREEEREEREWEKLGGRDEWEWKLKKRRRAEVVLWGVGEEEEIVEKIVAPPQQPIVSKAAVSAIGGQDPTRGQARGMGGLESISKTGIARVSQAKKIVFADDGDTKASKADGTPIANRTMNTINKAAVTGGLVKRKRKRKRRTTGMPDDDSSSESSSSSGSESEVKQLEVKMMTGTQQVKAKHGSVEAEALNLGSVSASDSGSGSGSDESTDSD